VLKDAMQTRIHRTCPQARLVMPLFEPVVGAYLLGLELDRPANEAIYTTLNASLAEAEARYGVKFRAAP
jgi:hypothetical protein